MRAGELRHRVTIERQSSYLTQWGHETAWRPVATVWANVAATAGAEKFDAKTSGVDGSTTYEVRLRHRRDLTTADRFIYGGKTLDLMSVIDPDGRRRELICVCVSHGSGNAAA